MYLFYFVFVSNSQSTSLTHLLPTTAVVKKLVRALEVVLVPVVALDVDEGGPE
jgi:hypothetical protein